MARYNEAMNNLMKFNTSLLPRKRSRFDRSYNHATTFDSSYLIPILVEDILPSDIVSLDISSLVKMATPLHPTMDSAYVDLFAFYAPSRLMWSNFTKFFGENEDAEYNDPFDLEAPNFTYTPDTYTDLMDYMGLPPIYTGESIKIKVERFRMYQRVWNEWFRASEIQNSVPMNYGDTVTNDEKRSVFTLRKVGKLHDYFTSALPYPQAGDSVFLPIGDVAPVRAVLGEHHSSASLTYSISGTSEQNQRIFVQKPLGGLNEIAMSAVRPSDYGEIFPNNLMADLSEASSVSINDLRLAATTQRLLELDALSGLRYTSLLRTHFGCITADDVLQRTMCLGTTRELVGMRTVAMVGSNTDGQYTGDLGAYSQTRMSGRKLVDQAFTEPGVIMVLACVRPLHTYAQGIDCFYTKLNRFDYFYPVFDGLGNQPIYSTELVASLPGENTPSDQVFGYKPYAEEYRVAHNRVSGKMRPQAEGSLATWNYADYYSYIPILNSNFISENENLIDRTIAVQNEPQFIGDFAFNLIHERPIGVRGMPGLTRF